MAAAVDHELARRAPATGLTVGNATAQFRPSWRSDPRNDLDPRRMHQREPLSLLLGILDGMARMRWWRLPLVDLARVSLVALINWTYLSPTS